MEAAVPFSHFQPEHPGPDTDRRPEPSGRGGEGKSEGCVEWGSRLGGGGHAGPLGEKPLLTGGSRLAEVPAGSGPDSFIRLHCNPSLGPPGHSADLFIC